MTLTTRAALTLAILLFDATVFGPGLPAAPSPESVGMSSEGLRR